MSVSKLLELRCNLGVLYFSQFFWNGQSWQSGFMPNPIALGNLLNLESCPSTNIQPRVPRYRCVCRIDCLGWTGSSRSFGVGHKPPAVTTAVVNSSWRRSTPMLGSDCFGLAMSLSFSASRRAADSAGLPSWTTTSPIWEDHLATDERVGEERRIPRLDAAGNFASWTTIVKGDGGKNYFLRAKSSV
jgi:hypothetical protein